MFSPSSSPSTFLRISRETILRRTPQHSRSYQFQSQSRRWINSTTTASNTAARSSCVGGIGGVDASGKGSSRETGAGGIHQQASQDFRLLMRHIAQPVAILTCSTPNKTTATSPTTNKEEDSKDSEEDNRLPFHGVTLSSFSSISLSPLPIASFALRKPSKMRELLLGEGGGNTGQGEGGGAGGDSKGGVSSSPFSSALSSSSSPPPFFRIHLLSQDQESLARLFAGQPLSSSSLSPSSPSTQEDNDDEAVISSADSQGSISQDRESSLLTELTSHSVGVLKVSLLRAIDLDIDLDYNLQFEALTSEGGRTANDSLSPVDFTNDGTRLSRHAGNPASEEEDNEGLGTTKSPVDFTNDGSRLLTPEELQTASNIKEELPARSESRIGGSSTLFVVRVHEVFSTEPEGSESLSTGRKEFRKPLLYHERNYGRFSG